jgi:hypothetical protein
MFPRSALSPGRLQTGKGRRCCTGADTLHPRHFGTAVNIKARLPFFPFGLCLRNAVLLAGAVAALSACGLRQPPCSMAQQRPARIHTRARRPHAVLEAQGRGDLLYECQAVKRAPYEYAWLLQTPGLKLQDSSGNTVMYYPGARARAGSTATAPGSPRKSWSKYRRPQNLPCSAPWSSLPTPPGTLANISYIQSRRTVGGVVANPPAPPPPGHAQMGDLRSGLRVLAPGG